MNEDIGDLYFQESKPFVPNLGFEKGLGLNNDGLIVKINHRRVYSLCIYG
jgi:hypothetical protein